jgi:hypothetical protein
VLLYGYRTQLPVQKGPERGGVRMAILNETIVSAAINRQIQKPRFAAVTRDESIDAADCTCVDIN